MELKTITWNIGGGKFLRSGADPGRLASYTADGLHSMADWLTAENPDIITLQETQKNEQLDQVAAIAARLGYKYFVHDSTSPSHIDTDTMLGHGIISRYPLRDHRTGFFDNPGLTTTWEDGSQAVTFDKGYTTCTADLGSAVLSVTTLHLMPFRRFGIDMESVIAGSILRNVSETLQPNGKRWLIQGDFNINSAALTGHLPELFGRNNLNEAILSEPTTPKGHRYDHILFRGITLRSMRIDNSVTSDHFPVIAQFNIES